MCIDLSRGLLAGLGREGGDEWVSRGEPTASVCEMGVGMSFIGPFSQEKRTRVGEVLVTVTVVDIVYHLVR